MKWIDRFGNHCEGTVSEYRKSLVQEDEPVKTKQVSDVDTVGRHWKRFSSVERRIIKDNPDMSVKELGRLLPNRSRPTIHKYRKKLLAKKYWHRHKKNDVVPKKTITAPVKPNGSRTRLQFMNAKANYYMKQFNWSRSKAWSKASMDWDAKRAGGVLTVPVVNPKVFRLMKLDFDDKSVKTVDVFASRDDAVVRRDELIIADQSINAHTEYYITDADNNKV